MRVLAILFLLLTTLGLMTAADKDADFTQPVDDT